MDSTTAYKRLGGENVGDSDDEPCTSQDTPLISNRSTMAPKDKWDLSYIIFYLLGLGSLLPWNFFITANEYWMYKLRDVNGSETNASTITPVPQNVTPNELLLNNTSNPVSSNPPSFNSLQSLFMNSLALCAMLPNVIFQFLNTMLQKRIPQNVRVIGTLILMIILFIITEIFVKVDVSSWQSTFFFVTLVTVALINSCSAVFQSSVFGVAACFPQKFAGAVMAGQGMGGVFAALAMIVALAYSNSPTDSAFIFFLTAIAVLTLTLGLYFCLIKLDFYRHFTRVLREVCDEKELSLGNASEKEPWVKQDRGDQNGIDVYDKTCINESEYEIGIKESTNVPSSPVLHVVKKIWLHMFCIVYTFFITLACFPAITAVIKPMESGTEWTDVYFTPVCCFLLFNVSDWTGRSMASYVHIPSSKNKVALFICVLLRTVFPFLFAFCNVQPRHLPLVFSNDAYFIVFMIIFGVSNGHLSTLCMQYGPKQVELAHAATAGSMLAFMISVGLLAGAGTSFIVKMLI